MKLYQYTAIDEYTRMRFLYGYEEQSTYSSADFAHRVVKWFKRRGITVECIQTDNGFEFTNRFSPAKDKPTLFESTLERLGIKHKLIRPYTPRHNGKVERSHREDHNKFYSCHSFYSCADLNAQLAARLGRTNNLPMRHWVGCRLSNFLKTFPISLTNLQLFLWSLSVLAAHSKGSSRHRLIHEYSLSNAFSAASKLSQS